MRIVLDRLWDESLKVKTLKCVLFKTEIAYLGRMVSDLMPDKIEDLKDWPQRMYLPFSGWRPTIENL